MKKLITLVIGIFLLGTLAEASPIQDKTKRQFFRCTSRTFIGSQMIAFEIGRSTPLGIELMDHIDIMMKYSFMDPGWITVLAWAQRRILIPAIQHHFRSKGKRMPNKLKRVIIITLMNYRGVVVRFCR